MVFVFEALKVESEKAVLRTRRKYPTLAVLDVGTGPGWLVLDVGTGPGWLVLDVDTGPGWLVLDVGTGPGWLVLDVGTGPGWLVLDVGTGPGSEPYSQQGKDWRFQEVRDPRKIML
jgi:ubiquinone/menaquinone biosynthesis C-methylase UbiE